MVPITASLLVSRLLSLARTVLLAARNRIWQAPIDWRFPCGAGRPAIFGDASR
jgi:hypothetical protein